MEREGGESRSIQMQDLFNCEQIDGEEAAYTGEMLVPIVGIVTD
jgi:hypothetical protein